MAAAGTSSLSTLLKKASLDDHQEILKASNAALKVSKNDVEAQHVKAVALLKLDRYDEALHLFEEAGSKLKERAALEYAYSLYKVGRLDEACKISSEIEDNRGAQHVEAQARYRSEDFARTVDLYRILSAQRASTEDFDLRVNQGAVKAQTFWSGSEESAAAEKVGREDLEAFETAYNAACTSIARGELGQAEVLLKRAKQLCQHSDDLTAEQKEDELLPICVQQLYVLFLAGKTADAEKIATEITVEKISDLSTRKVAQNNLLMISSNTDNPFLAHSRFNSTPNIPESDKLFGFQSRGLTAGEKSIDLRAFKFDGVAASTAKELLKYPLPSTNPEVSSLGVLNAAAHARNEVGKAALNRVLPELEKRPSDVGLILTIVQLYASTGNCTAAIHLIESFFKRLDDSVAEKDQDVRFSPGLVSVLIGLYRLQGRKSHIKQELAKAASYWRRKSKAPTVMLHAAGASLLESSDPQDLQVAKDIFDKLHAQNPTDKAATAGYVASHISTVEPPSELKTAINSLTPVASLIKDVNVDALESSGIPQPSNALAIAQLGKTTRKRTAPADGSADSKPKRIRKSRLPKDYDPDKKPDPERWLALRDRSTYRPKGKKKGKRGGDDRTQGGVVADDVGVNGVGAGKPVIAASGGAGGANKKKKGKGKK